jgi:uncharacterized protein (DUF849 family)
VGAGAGALHLHPKDAHGADTLDGTVLAEVLRAVRSAVPGTPVGTTTGAWAVDDPAERCAAVRGWEVLPDYASVNWHEDGSEQLAELLLHRGIGVEAGLWTPAAVAAWVRWPRRAECTRVLLEVGDGFAADGGLDQAELLVSTLGDTAGDVPVLLHGEGITAWPVLADAVRRGMDTRIGLEDVLVGPDGDPVSGNADLVRIARSLVAGSGPLGSSGDR